MTTLFFVPRPGHTPNVRALAVHESRSWSYERGCWRVADLNRARAEVRDGFFIPAKMKDLPLDAVSQLAMLPIG